MRAGILLLLLPLIAATPAAIDPLKAKSQLENVNDNTKPEAEVPAKEVNDKAEDEATKPDDKKTVELPEALTMENFDKITSEKLSFVEFFSPYCSHCLALAPVWEDTFLSYTEEMTRLNIQMRQVNCIESGDLCEREDVNSYPNLRLYSPEKDPKSGQFLPGKSKFVDSFPRSLLRTKENFLKYMTSSVAEFDSGAIDMPSASNFLTVDELLKFANGDIEGDEPVFVLFIAAKKKHWATSDSSGKNHFADYCLDCFEHKKVWDRLSNHIISTVKTAHFTCLDNPLVCQKLGFKEMSDIDRPATPKAVMFLPKSAGAVRFDYKLDFTVDSLKSWATKLFHNHHYEIVSAKDLIDSMDFKKSLPQEPLKLEYPLKNSISVVFFYDSNSVTDEDKAILPYMLEVVTRSPFHVNLFSAKHKKIEINMETQAKSLVEFINYDEKAPAKKFDESMYLATTITTKPTILIFKDNALFSNVFQSFAPEDIRSEQKVQKFIEENLFPLYQELTPELTKFYFDSKSKSKTNKKVVITFVDGSDKEELNKQLYSISLAAHEYHFLKQQHFYKDILNAREEKAQTVNELKEKNADSTDITHAMRKKIPHEFYNDEAVFVYIDITKNSVMSERAGWNVNGEKYGAGDTIIVSRDNRYYWSQDAEGAQLVNEPRKLKTVLLYLLDPALVADELNGRVIFKNLVGSPWGQWAVMNNIHDKGFKGYVEVIFGLIVLISVLRVVMRFGRRRFRTKKQQGSGILGVTTKKD